MTDQLSGVSDSGPPRPGWTKFFPVAAEGLPLILTFLVAAAVLYALYAASGVKMLIWLASPVLVVALFSFWFFRDPERQVPRDPNLVLSAADGRVTSIRQDDEGFSIAVFLNIFDVHVNRSPAAGAVRRTEYKPGEFLSAMKPLAQDVNERLTLLLDTPRGPVEVVQVAGLIARRIICRARAGDRLAAGERYGLIRFGSCTIVRLPPGAVPLVRVNDRVVGGVTPIARWP